MTDTEILAHVESLQTKCTENLITRGILKRVTSIVEYSSLIMEAKRKAEIPLYSNCYLKQDEIKRLIAQQRFYLLLGENNGVLFLEDHKSHYQGYFFADLRGPLRFPKLDKSILIEHIYRAGGQIKLPDAEFHFYDTFQQMGLSPHLSPVAFWNMFDVSEALFQKKGFKFETPTDEQLIQCQELYHNNMDKYSQVYYSMEERKLQRDKGLLQVASDKKGIVHALLISPFVRGEAIVSRKEIASAPALTALLLLAYKPFYENYPSDPDKIKDYMRPKSFAWVARSNYASDKMQKRLMIQPTGKFMDQYVMPGRYF